MKEKLWSPKKPKPGWIIWYEDNAGPGDMHTFVKKVEAEERIKELLSSVVEEILRDFDDPDDDPEGERDDEREQLLHIQETMKAKPWDALFAWAQYESDFDPEQKIHVEETTVYGA